MGSSKVWGELNYLTRPRGVWDLNDCCRNLFVRERIPYSIPFSFFLWCFVDYIFRQLGCAKWRQFVLYLRLEFFIKTGLWSKDTEAFLSSTQTLLLKRFILFPARYLLLHSIQIQDGLPQVVRRLSPNQCSHGPFHCVPFSRSALLWANVWKPGFAWSFTQTERTF